MSRDRLRAIVLSMKFRHIHAGVVGIMHDPVVFLYNPNIVRQSELLVK